MIKISQDVSSEPVTTTEIRQFIKHGDDTDTSEISLIEDMISAVRVYLENRTGLCLAEKTLVEDFSEESTGEYVLSYAPVSSVSSVVTKDLEEDETTLTLNDDYYLRGQYERTLLTTSVSSNEKLYVTYVVGYGDNTESLPADIKEAIKKQVIQWYDNRDEYIEGRFLNEVSRIIQYYKRSFF